MYDHHKSKIFLHSHFGVYKIMDLVELAMLLETMDVTEATEEQFKEAADVVSKSTFLPDEQV